MFCLHCNVFVRIILQLSNLSVLSCSSETNVCEALEATEDFAHRPIWQSSIQQEMASLRQLLADEGFEQRKVRKHNKVVRKSIENSQTDEQKELAAYMCNDLRNFDFSKQKTGKTVSSRGSSEFHSRRRAVSLSGRSNCNSLVGRGISEEPPIDEVSIRAVIAILSGYAGRYIRDEDCRNIIREKCSACLFKRRDDFDDSVLVNLQMGIDSIERLLKEQGTKKQQRLKALRNAIQLLNIVASLNSNNSNNDSSVCGIPNSYVSACAHLYLAIVYKLEKNDRISARHLLRVFCGSPFLARTHLLPDLWEHFFLPHLLHLKVWYAKEFEYLSFADDGEKEKKIKALSNVYNSHMDKGTTLFALYYKQWLKVGNTGPPLPTIPLPATPSYHKSRRKSADSRSSQTSINRNLYQAVFGTKIAQKSLNLDQEGIGVESWFLETDGESKNEEKSSTCVAVQKLSRTHSERPSYMRIYRNREAKLQPELQRVEQYKWFSCRTLPTECLIAGNNVSKRAAILSIDFERAIAAICSSDVLSECEAGIRVLTKVWLDLQGEQIIEHELSKAPVIEGMMEVLSASEDDEVLELLISILAELTRSEIVRQIILNSDPHLEIFTRLLRSNSLFLKAAVLLYLSKPLAKQMVSSEWVTLALRVLEFGEQLQTLFTVQCYPKVAAYYILDQLVTGFDEDRNLENARLVVSFGGLTMLMKRIEKGDIHERNNAALTTYCCIRAEGSCRNFVADHLNMASLLELIALDNHKISGGYAFCILAELLCLNRRTEVLNFLNGLKEGWGGLNVLHILLVYLLKAPPEEHPIVATILFLLDAMEGNLKTSLYIEEAIEAIIGGLECQQCNDKVQQQSARALHMLGGRFSHTGEPKTEKWLLDEAGFQQNCVVESFQSKRIDTEDFIDMNEDEVTENWQKTVALILLNNRDKRFLTALIDCIANGIPQLARASIITVSWMSRYLHLVEDSDLKSMAISILMPQLLESLNFDKDAEERVLASYSLLCLMKSSENVSLLGSFPNGTSENLRQLSLVTWTASEFLS